MEKTNEIREYCRVLKLGSINEKIDQIINDAFPIGRAPSITWHYFRLNRSFIFADERGFGQYRLRNKDEEYKDF